MEISYFDYILCTKWNLFKRKDEWYKYSQEIIDRDLMIIYENNENIYHNSKLVSKSLKESIKLITSQYQVNRKMILIGKDGGVKRVFSTSDQISKVFDWYNAF